MYYVYILEDLDHRLHIGYSGDLKRRLKEHNNKTVFTTKKINHPTLIYYEAYNNEGLAKTRETKLKQFGSSYHGLIKRIRIN